jgi:hypothetical protein
VLTFGKMAISARMIGNAHHTAITAEIDVAAGSAWPDR